MKREMRSFVSGVVLAAVAATVGGCDSDLPPPSRQAGSRAVQDPLGQSSPDHEYLAEQPDAVPLLKIEGGGKKGEPAQVTTIFDALHPTPVRTTSQTPPPAAAPPVMMRGSFDTTVTPPAVTTGPGVQPPSTQP